MLSWIGHNLENFASLGNVRSMTTLQQIEANRRNAARSTGPKTQHGKNRSRRNAIRHGLSGETVIEIVEDLDDYCGFEAAVIADYDPITAVERELVLRLASLLWRLRRALAIETDLFRIQTDILRDLHPPERRQHDSDSPGECLPRLAIPIRDLTHAFQRQNDLDNGAFDRLGRYEAALWRQMIKTLLILRHRVRV
jgi:hypothetical protein